ncbi:MAG: CpsB/CapC family capsule biosynthesis tyrosine phosphatase [Halioglobus sp.]
MIDLHCHLLPGIDDGPDTLEQSLELCRIAVADGTTHAIVTPHIHPGRWENNRASIAKQCQSLQAALADKDISLQLGFAAEVRLTDQVMQQIADDDIPFYGEVDGYKIMLLEFPHGHIIPGSEKLAQWLLNQGIRPMIAHPERNKQLMKDVSQLQPFIELGCWLQITAGAVTGGFGERAQAIAHQLLEDDVVTVMASDGHNAGARQPALRQAFNVVAERYGEDRALRLVQHTPATIVADQFGGQVLPA